LSLSRAEREKQALTVLDACRGLLTRIEASGQGIHYEPTAEDQPIIEAAMHLCVEYAGPEHELALELLRQRAGLSPSGWALVRGTIEAYTLRLPGVAQRRAEELQRHFGRERGAMSEYEALCTLALRRAQEWGQDQFVVEDADGRLSLAGEITAIDWTRAVVVTAVGPDGRRRRERRPQG
jgi:hypothetical protein